MVKKIYFIFLLFFSCPAFAQKTYIHCGKPVDSISGTEQKAASIVAGGNIITGIKQGNFNLHAGNKQFTSR